MTTIILIILGVLISVAVAITWAAIIRSQARRDEDNERIIELLDKIISDTSELDALRCVNPLCKRRNTPGEEARKLLDRIADTARRKKYAEDVANANKEAAESAKETGPFCGDCKVNQFCEKALNIAQLACNDFELDDDH
jgi:hypothetical protein